VPKQDRRRLQITEPVAGSAQQALLASVIVPVFNGAGTLDACVSALGRQSVSAASYEVIVVNDGSTDHSAEVARRHGVAVLDQDRAGAAAARNRGAQVAQGGLLLFTDADCEPMPDWIEEMVAPFADPEVAGVKGRYRTRQCSLVARFAQAEYEEKYDRLARTDGIDFVDTHAAAYRRAIFLQHGGFDPEFKLDEDQEFSFRLAEAGCKLVFAPAAVVYHKHPDTVRSYAFRKMQLARWKVRVHLRHPGKAIRDSYTPWTQKVQLVLLPLTAGAAFGATLGPISWSWVSILAVIGLLSSLPLLVKASRQGWQVAALTPALVLIRALSQCLGLAWGMAGQSWLRP
jgi:cellulose synthase/poly-beta-1,6-N-acetylglucosamine synthase-like glycosyltransferase